MTDQVDIQEDVVVDELETLKERADDLGIKYRSNVTVDKLRELVNEAIAPKQEAKPKTDRELRNERKKEALKLVRVNVTCMDPKKKEWEGEVIKVISNVTGSVTKYVAFGTENGYHIPQIIYQHLKDVMYQGFRYKKDKFGNDVPEAYRAKAYSIEVLPPLTEKELAELKESQLARGM